MPTLALSTETVHREAVTEEVHVWGSSLSSADAGYTSPNSILLPRDMVSINAATTEDLVKFEPSLVIRRRFIGDANGTLGMRGSNMFQTARSMVFADGVPLHYLLQSRWNGAPRWTMVSASEIEKVEVLYGPFSAEYSGNAMGGVVLIETAIPQQQEFHIDISTFSQQFDDYGFDDTLHGYKGFASFGNKVGDLSYYLSFNRLENDAQPQTFRGAARSGDGSTTVSGGIQGVDARNRERLWYGDTGVVTAVTNNYKLKVGYDFGAWQSLLNLAFEDRASENVGNSYLRDEQDNTLWRGDNLIDNGYPFAFDSRRLNDNILDRESASVGLRLKGELAQATQIQVNLNQFDILTDQRRASRTHPDDPAFTPAGQINEYEDSGWQTAEAKLASENVLVGGLQIIAGVRHENYELNLNQFDSPDYRSGVKGSLTSRFGGKTEINAAFVQANWDLTASWDLALGARYERFESADGYYSEQDVNTGNVDLVAVPDTDSTKISPKFSIGFTPDNEWRYRYSIAKAYRFPIAEELFRQYESYNSINEANPELKPENGLHHNVMIERALQEGYLRLNLFHESIKDAIESQSTTTPGGQSLSTFVPLDKTRATGIEFIVNQYDIIHKLDVRLNITYTDAEIIENAANPEWEGNIYPRMPKWRGNLLATYHVNDIWNLGLTTQYASDAYGRIQNDDSVDNVYGAQDGYTRIGMKTNYSFSEHLSTSFGIDNVTNEIAYVAHPWPGRVFYLSLAYNL